MAKRRARFGRIMALVVAGTALVGTTQIAAQQKERINTRITIKDRCGAHGGGGPFFNCRVSQRNYRAAFFGRVKSQEDKCERRRRVSLFRARKTPGDYGKIDETRSKPSGRWEIDRDDKPGFVNYYVRVSRAERGDVVCKPARSRVEEHGIPPRPTR